MTWRPRRRRWGGSGTERGSVSAMEMIMLAPVFLLLFLFVVFCGRLVNVKGVVEGAARDGARAASIARSAADAEAAADTAFAEDLSTLTLASCNTGSQNATGWAPGGEVAVDLTCTVRLADLAMLGVPGTKTISVHHAAPVDQFRGTP